jgi:archaellum component FlaC
MKLQEELRSVKEVFPLITDMLEAAAQRIEDQRLWRGAWLDAESRVELLTREINVLRSQLQHRKEKG